MALIPAVINKVYIHNNLLIIYSVFLVIERVSPCDIIMCIFAYMFSHILVYSFLYSVACLWGNYFNVKSVCKHHFEIQHILNFAFVSSLNKEQCDIRGRPLSKVYLNVIDGQIDMRAFITLPTNLCKLCLSYEDLLL